MWRNVQHVAPNTESGDMDLTVDSPAAYRIRVKGALDPSWSDRLGGLTITHETPGDDPTVTTLCGRVLDQAALRGILDALYCLHLPLISVTYLFESPAQDGVGRYQSDPDNG